MKIEHAQEEKEQLLPHWDDPWCGLGAGSLQASLGRFPDLARIHSVPYTLTLLVVPSGAEHCRSPRYKS